MKVTRTEQIFIHGNGAISSMCHISKNLFNQANYILRKQFFNKEKMSSYKELAKEFAKPSDMEENNNFQKLPAQTAQWTIKKVKQSWTSFFGALRSYKKNPELFNGVPKPPKYKHKNGEFMLIFTNQQCSIDNKILKFPKIMDLEVETRLDNNINLREVRLIPSGAGYNVEIVYAKEIGNVSELSPKRILGIDIGVRNIITIGNNISEKGIAVKGGVLKSINQYFNKELARLKSVNDKQGNKENTKRIDKLYMVRNRKIKDIMHKLSNAVILYAMNNEIDTIVIGHNNGWKQSVDIGKKNNQNFVQIPFNMLVNQIYYKGKEYGINVVKQEESYTSKCSFLDSEEIDKHETYLGKRIKRGIFKSSNGTLIHADLHASYNIMKKAIPEAFVNGIEGIGLYPGSLSIKEMITSKGGC